MWPACPSLRLPPLGNCDSSFRAWAATIAPASCPDSIKRLPGIAEISTSIANHRVTVHFDPAATIPHRSEPPSSGPAMSAVEEAKPSARERAVEADIEERYLAKACRRGSTILRSRNAGSRLPPRSMTRKPIAMKRCPSIRVGASSTKIYSSSSRSCRNSSPHAAFRTRRRLVTWRTTFSRPLQRKKRSAAARFLSQAVIAMPFNSLQIAPPSCFRFAQARWLEYALRRSASATVSSRCRCRISSLCAATRQTKYRELRGWGPLEPPHSLNATAASTLRSLLVAFRRWPTRCVSIRQSRRWIERHRFQV